MTTLVKNYKLAGGVLFGLAGASLMLQSTSTRVQAAIIVLWISTYSIVILYSIYKKTNILNTRLNNIKRTLSDQEEGDTETAEYLQKQIKFINKQISIVKKNINGVSQETNKLHISALKSTENMHKIVVQNQEAILELCQETVKLSHVKPEPYTLLSERRESTLTNSPGRMAAAVASDRMRSKRLARALGSIDSRGTSARRVGVIGSDRLRGFIEARSTVVSFRPSESAAQFQAFEPDLLVIEEHALIHGLWSGALSSTGLALFDEIYKLIIMAKKSNIIVVVIRNHRVPDVNTPQLLEHALVIDKSTVLEDEWSEGYHLSTLESLRNYCIEK